MIIGNCIKLPSNPNHWFYDNDMINETLYICARINLISSCAVTCCYIMSWEFCSSYKGCSLLMSKKKKKGLKAGRWSCNHRFCSISFYRWVLGNASASHLKEGRKCRFDLSKCEVFLANGLTCSASIDMKGMDLVGSKLRWWEIL